MDVHQLLKPMAATSLTRNNVPIVYWLESWAFNPVEGVRSSLGTPFLVECNCHDVGSWLAPKRHVPGWRSSFGKTAECTRVDVDVQGEPSEVSRMVGVAPYWQAEVV